MLLEPKVPTTFESAITDESAFCLLRSGLSQESLLDLNADPFTGHFGRVETADIARHGFELVHPALR